MGMVVFLVVVVAVVGVVAFVLRSVFGGSTFRRERGRKGKDDHGGPPGPRPDSHAGATSWTGGGGFGRWNTWSGGG
ncbi:MAG TPA: hypothetical protein VF228_08495 [Iamia sp.]